MAQLVTRDTLKRTDRSLSWAAAGVEEPVLVIAEQYLKLVSVCCCVALWGWDVLDDNLSKSWRWLLEWRMRGRQLNTD